MKIFLLLTLFISPLLQAKVWHSQSAWTQESSKEFSNWIASDEYNVNLFQVGSKWENIKTDCADAIIAAQVIFAFERRIQFSLQLSEGSAHSITSDSHKFDQIQDDVQRVKSFIHYLGESIGTEGLARYNSYPIDLREIRPGDFYISRWKTNGNFIRHAAMIKEVLPTGHLVLYSSTTPVKVRELEVREGMPLHVLSGKPWGFKRIRPAAMSVHELEDYSLNQYDLLNQVGEDSFFPRVIDHLKVEEDSLEENLKRRVRNLCSQLKLRNREINSTQIYLESIGHRCMNYSEYDEHSTPSRDKSLLNGIKRLLYGWKKIRRSNSATELSHELTSALDSILRKNDSDEARLELRKMCHIRLNLNGENLLYDLKNFFDLSMKGQISSHPNDTVAKRWGAPGQNTSCKSFY
ncbi:hypothetical protein BIY24_12120 [Halobacteriovorax marinus]|uniref:hypothetical protein n=1 Tax=Halobacteriovorax marinus TaxID=97084 RepID=UPI000BC3174C|nr:hypothetical protein [Halobacteriovorax marinus]ATH08666.1 hypothetical protein BIY24_12120 [Halobacteriovorax marinus]